MATIAQSILVVEDEPAMVYLLRQLFFRNGYTVFAATDGKEAIETYCRHKSEIDLVFLDVGLPKVKGLEVLYKMKSENPNVRVVIASGYLEPELRTTLQQAGVRHFIDKPYKLDQLLETIQSLIETP